MPDPAPAKTTNSPTTAGVMARRPGETVVVDPVWDERAQRLHLLMQDNMPPELRKMAGDLMASLRNNAGLAERFDAFCVQAFSKPDWAVPASAFISELFENNEDRLAELARVPDLVIELACGQAALACTVASKWATRGETHRLSRLAESIVAAQGTMKNSAAVEVMLALSATLAVTRPSRAEQLFHAAGPLAAAEHAEALTDAKLWLAVGKVLASAPQEVRDLWDTRMRRPRATWKWESDEERRALRYLAEQMKPEMDTAHLFRQVVPACWWEVAMQRVKDEQVWQRKWETVKRKRVTSPADDTREEPETEAPAAPPKPRPQSHAFGDTDVLAVRPHASSVARFVLGWAVGVFLMSGTFFLFPEEVYNAIKDFRTLLGPSPRTPAKVTRSPAAAETAAPASGKEWRAAQVANFAKTRQSLEPLVRQAKSGTWAENQMLLSGHAPELPFDDEEYLQLLVWLHLDPPSDPETRQQLPRLLIDKADVSAMAVWEGLMYPGSPNANEIRATAQAVYKEKATVWSREDLARLQAICDAKP